MCWPDWSRCTSAARSNISSSIKSGNCRGYCPGEGGRKNSGAHSIVLRRTCRCRRTVRSAEGVKSAAHRLFTVNRREGRIMDRREWPEGVTILLGVWILISPMVLGFAPGQRDVTWNSWVIGVVLLIVAAGRAAAPVPKVWPEGANLVLAVWLILSPWILEFAAHAPARNSTLVAGIVVAGVSLWARLAGICYRHGVNKRILH